MQHLFIKQMLLTPTQIADILEKYLVLIHFIFQLIRVNCVNRTSGSAAHAKS